MNMLWLDLLEAAGRFLYQSVNDEIYKTVHKNENKRTKKRVGTDSDQVESSIQFRSDDTTQTMTQHPH